MELTINGKKAICIFEGDLQFFCELLDESGYSIKRDDNYEFLRDDLRFRWNLLQPEKNVLVSSCMPWLISSFASLRVQYPPKRLNSVSSAQALFAEFGRAQGESLIFR